jgi:hypothetical protein
MQRFTNIAFDEPSLFEVGSSAFEISADVFERRVTPFVETVPLRFVEDFARVELVELGPIEFTRLRHA